MATSLPPDLLELLRQYYADPNMAGFAMPHGDMAYTPQWERWTGGTEGEPMRGTGQILGWDAVDPAASIKTRQISEFDPAGNYTGARADTYSPLAMDLLKFGAIAAGLHGLGGMMTGAMGGGVGGLGGLTAEQAAFLEANMGAGAPGAGWGSAAAGGTGGVGTLASNLGGIPAVTSGGVPSLAATGALAPALTASGIGGATIPAGISAGLGGLLSGASSLVGGAKGAMALGGLLGGIAGAQGGDDTTASNKRTLDPRLDSAIFGANGQGGLLGRVLEYANQNPTGQNDVMKQASDRQKALLNDPRLWGGLSNLYTQSQGLLNQGVAPNPFKDWRP